MKKERIRKIHKDAESLKHARFYLRDNYISLLTTGDVCALQMEVLGNALLEPQLDNQWNIVKNGGKIIIYTLHRNIKLPEVLFFYYGDIEIKKALCCDWFGKAFEPYVLIEKEATDAVNFMSTDVGKNTGVPVELYNTKSKRYARKSSKGVTLVPKETLAQYKQKKIEDIESIVKTSAKYKPSIRPISAKIKPKRIKGGY